MFFFVQSIQVYTQTLTRMNNGIDPNPHPYRDPRLRGSSDGRAEARREDRLTTYFGAQQFLPVPDVARAARVESGEARKKAEMRKTPPQFLPQGLDGCLFQCE